MKPLKERIWCDDFEVVYESKLPYVYLLKNLSSLVAPVFSIENANEKWLRDTAESIDIRISYNSNGRTHIIWTERWGDYLNMQVLVLMNKQLNLTETKFEFSYGEESVYFISASEKNKLEEEGIVFDQFDPSLQFEFLLYNILMDFKHGENDFTYELIGLLVQEAEEYCNQNWQTKEFKKMQDSIRVNVLPRINFEKTNELGIETEKLYVFVNKAG